MAAVAEAEAKMCVLREVVAFASRILCMDKLEHVIAASYFERRVMNEYDDGDCLLLPFRFPRSECHVSNGFCRGIGRL